MYECPVCRQQIQLTNEQHEIITQKKEVNLKCNCGFLNIMVGAEYEENDYYNDGKPYYNVYSYDVIA